MSPSKHKPELLNSETIKKLIVPENLPLLSTIIIFDVLRSTNDYLLEGAKSGMSSGTVCFAEEQTSGRGRHGRNWFSALGAGLACSILWYFPPTQNNLSALPMAVSIMVTRALEKYGITAGIDLKWPNDIFFRERKLAGILLEKLPEKNGKIPVVIGIGLNLQLPAEYKTQWSDVMEMTGKFPHRNQLAGLLVNELLSGLKDYEIQGFKAFLSAWRDLDYLCGKEITVHIGDSNICGIMQGINEQGEMLLQTESGASQVFQCGEVSVRLRK